MPLLSRPFRCFVMGFSLAMSFVANPLSARPAYKKALADFLGLVPSSRLNDCRTCHLPARPGQDPDEKPHNPFGARLKAIKAELKKAGKPADIPDRLRAVAEEDSDGDGTPNLLELLAGHNPGEADDRASPAEISAARQKLAFLLRQATGYPWRPFRKVSRPAMPAVKNVAWVRNPIDAFLAAEHEARGLKPRPESTLAVMLRRVYLDLIGLPPTPEELHAFLADHSTDAYEKVVDDLLARPQYGERWGRHWMDIWRYSDWAGWGQQVRDSQPHIWHWRDWIIESLNADKGYDQMILEMLAGDELPPDDSATLRATGYLVRNYKLLSREKWLQDTVEHTFLAFQGVTINCARCHDHMYDPILQKEYYQVRALFEPHKVRMDRLPGEPDIKKDGIPRVYDADLTMPTFLFVRGDDRTPDKAPVTAGVPEALGGRFGPVLPVTLPKSAYAPERRQFAVTENRANSEQAVARAHQELAPARLGMARQMMYLPFGAPAKALDKLALAELDVSLAEARHTELVAVDKAEDLKDKGSQDTPEGNQAGVAATRAQRRVAILEARRLLLLARQTERDARSEKVKQSSAKKTAAAAAAVAKAEAAAQKPDSPAYNVRSGTLYPATSTGRRLALAHWLANRENPLTARVAMNHVWLRHFGQAIVPSVFDFGRNGRPPSHPALLDWLAAEFMKRGWSQKAIHRLIVTSTAYRQASTPDEANLALDRDNTYLWRMPSRRLEAEVVRDCVFYVAGRLDLTQGGPDLDHGLGLAVPRRSLYFRHAAEKQMEFLKIFDCASVTECYQRKDSILPQQALALANSELSLRHARLVARDLAARFSEPAAFTTAAFERVLARGPTRAELEECLAFLREQATRHAGDGSAPAGDARGSVPAADPTLHARENLVHVLLNHHDFVTVR